MQMALDILTFAASLVSVLGVVSLLYLLNYWITAPKFIIGVLPTKSEMEKKNLSIGSPSFFDEIHFNSKIFARKINREKKLQHSS